MKPTTTLIAAGLLALAVSAGTSVVLHKRGTATATTTAVTTTYDRVLASGKLRAAYVNYPPGCKVDAATGQVTGIAVDILNKIGQNTGLKVEYTEEVGWGTMIAGLDAGRYDIIGSPSWANSARGKVATLSTPIYYTGVGVWVRPEETRFTPDNSWESLNKPDVRIAAMDGSTPEKIAKTMFPNATVVSYPDQTGEPQLFLDVTSNKADVFFAEPSQGISFLKSNPGKVKNLAAAHPIKVFPNVFLMKGGEPRLKAMIDTALEELENSGVVDQILRKYEPGPNAFYRVATPYRVDE